MAEGPWTNPILRLLLLPLVAVIDVLQAPWSLISDEPSRSNVWGAQTSLATAQRPGEARAAAAIGLPGTADSFWPSLFRKPDLQWVWRRVRDAWHEGWQMIYTAVVYNGVVFVVKLLGLGPLFTRLEPKIRTLLANMRLVGRYELLDGRTEVFSFANSFLETDFLLPPNDYEYHSFPFKAGEHANGPGTGNVQATAASAVAKRAHVCALASFAAYEEQWVVKDIVTRWNFTFLDDQKADHGSATAPRTYWFSFYSDDAVILCFRGTAPINLLNWQTNIDLSMTDRPGFGQVHDGWYEALFGPAEHARSLQHGLTDASKTVFASMLNALQKPEVAKKPIYICGHSLGGAFAVVSAMGLAVHEPEVAARVAGVLTFGQPRVGDGEFVHNFEAKFGANTLRYVHGSDIVTRVPAGLGYEHHGAMRYIPSIHIGDTGRVLTVDNEIKQQWDWETNFGVALMFSVLKLLRSQVNPPREALMHTVTRFFLLLLPGVLDHFDYVRPLKKDLYLQSDTKMKPRRKILARP